MKIKKENVVNAYKAGDNSVKNVLRAMFPDIEFEASTAADNRPVTDRIKTFEDACAAVGIDPEQFEEQYGEAPAHLQAYLKLDIICQALNEGWEPEFTGDEWRWYPWHLLWTEDEMSSKDEDWKRSKALIPTGDYVTEYAGFACAFSSSAPSGTTAYIGSRLCLKSEVLSDYCGKQFIRLWADFKLRRR